MGDEVQRKTLVVDVDGTLCPIKKRGELYEDMIPYPEMVEALQKWKAEGGYIIVNTARNMKTYAGVLGLINANTAPVMVAWLNRHNIPFDEIIFGKPWAGSRGVYVDDRTVRPREFINHTLEELEQIIIADRLD